MPSIEGDPLEFIQKAKCKHGNSVLFCRDCFPLIPPFHPRCRCVLELKDKTFTIPNVRVPDRTDALEYSFRETYVIVCGWCHNETTGVLCIKCRALYEMRRRDDH